MQNCGRIGRFRILCVTVSFNNSFCCAVWGEISPFTIVYSIQIFLVLLEVISSIFLYTGPLELSIAPPNHTSSLLPIIPPPSTSDHTHRTRTRTPQSHQHQAQLSLRGRQPSAYVHCMCHLQPSTYHAHLLVKLHTQLPPSPSFESSHWQGSGIRTDSHG